MEQDFIQIRDILAAVSGITLVDEDTGQLEAMLNGEESYPITFPAALILFGETDWRSFNGESPEHIPCPEGSRCMSRNTDIQPKNRY